MLSVTPLPDEVPSCWSPVHSSFAAAQLGEREVALASFPSTATAVCLTRRTHADTHILLIEDDDWLRELVARVLLENGYQVTPVDSAECALEMLRLAPYDLVLSDVMLSGMSGIDLTLRLSRTHPDLPIVLITGNITIETMQLALRVGACDFIGKPFSIDSIPMVVARSLERRAIEHNRIVEHEETVTLTAVRALTAVIETKEPFTAQHSRRVAMLADGLGEAMGLSCSDRRALELAAQLHDIGKIKTPESILCKEGSLTPDEWEVMKLHPIAGAEILSRLDELAYVADAVRHHHEWQDGSGYPDNLHGDAIPLLSRIISVADAFEVMTARRPYRKVPFSREEAMARLQERAGVQFDAAIVETFARVRPDTHLL
jgi:putative nucleotidyltransferase with HDIG domain